MSLVMTYIREDRFDEAQTFLQSVVKANPNNTVALQILAQFSLRENDENAAAGYFVKTIEADPGAESAYQKLASIHIGNNKLSEAEAVLQAGLQELPDSALLSIEQARIHQLKGDIDSAIAIYERLLQANPGLTIVRNNLASLLTDFSDDQASHDRARKIAAPLRDESLPQYRDTYAWAAIKSGLFLEEAVLILQDIVKKNETVGVYHYHLGEGYRKKGSSFKARTHLRKALELETPGSPIAIEARKSLTLTAQ
jgi:tetratricopeptide (TPR) repeat protein